MRIIDLLLNLFRFDRTNWKAVSLCFLASMVFWIFNSLNKQHATTIRFPLSFEFDTEKYALVEPLPKSIYLNVTGSGWDLFRKRFGYKKPSITIPLERPNEVTKMIGSSMMPLLTSQVGGLTINFVVTDTIRIKIDKKKIRRYKLVVDISAINYNEGYGRVGKLSVLPDSVQLEGPERILRQLNDSLWLKINKQTIDENFQQEVEVTFEGSNMVKRNPPIARVMFDVAEVKKIGIKLKVNSNKINLLPDSVTAMFQIPVSHLSEFTEQSKSISAQLNTNRVKNNFSTWPQLLNVPAYAVLLHVDSVRVANKKN